MAHRTDDHKPYVFGTTDFGETWMSIAGNLPEGNVNVIREDPQKPRTCSTSAPSTRFTSRSMAAGSGNRS